jgi:general nucleoside transport system permease protein
MTYDILIQLFASTIRRGVPLLLTCLAGLYSERAGIFDIGLEGKMLMAAFAAGAVASITGSAWLGLLAGVGGSLLLSAVHGLASVTFRGNQLISGVAINFLASGLTVLIGQSLFGLGGGTPPVSFGNGRFAPISLPLAETLKGVPIFGQFYHEVLSGHSILVYAGFLCVPLTYWVLYRSRFGLRLRAVGENPAAVDTAGISVKRLRYTAVAICGVLVGLAGVYLSIGLSAGFGREMSAGRGYIALAALIFAKWRPWYALGATMLFGFLEAFGNQFQNIDIGVFVVPVQFMQALPYILTVIILAGFVGRAIPPRAGGEPYVKER